MAGIFPIFHQRRPAASRLERSKHSAEQWSLAWSFKCNENTIRDMWQTFWYDTVGNIWTCLLTSFILKGLLAFVLLWFTLPVFVSFSLSSSVSRVFVVYTSFSFLCSLLNFSFVSCLSFQFTVLLSCIWVIYLWKHNSLRSFLYKKISSGPKLNIFHEDISTWTT